MGDNIYQMTSGTLFKAFLFMDYPLRFLALFLGDTVICVFVEKSRKIKWSN